MGVLVVYAASRVFSTTLLALTLLAANANGWDFASNRQHPDFASFSGMWDASFYRRIAEDGYPGTLPTDAAGHVLPNAWAFLPLFPWVAQALAAATGLGFYAAGAMFATVCGGAAAVVLHRLLLARTSPRAALWATAFFCFGPIAFLLQVAYAESLALLLTFGALLALVRRRYALMTVLAVAAAFTRPGILALALALGIHFLVRLRGAEPFPPRDKIAVILSAAVVSVAGLAWPMIASAATGRPDAYLDTELSWWVGFVGRVDFVPLTPWFLMAGKYLGIAGIALVVALAGCFAWWLLRRPTRELGHEIVGHSGSYAFYLVAVFLPQQSLFRLILPLAPLLGSATFTRTRARRVTVLAVGMALQPVAIILLWFLGYP